MDEKVLYEDSNLKVQEGHILLKDYYFLRFGEKKLKFSEIERFEEVRLTYFNGMARHEHIWLKPRWPFDWKCHNRTEAIFLKVKGKSVGIGIAAEQPRELALILHKKLDSREPIPSSQERPVLEN